MACPVPASSAAPVTGKMAALCSLLHLPPAFARLAWANLAAQSAEQLSLAAVPLVAVLMLGSGPGEIGLAGGGADVAFPAVVHSAGVLADRTSRRRLMVGAELLRAISLVALLAMAFRP
jgi:hypothetical protein